MAGCASRDNEALRRELDRFRLRLEREVARSSVLSVAGAVVDEALAASPTRIDPSSEGGPL